MCIRDSYAAVNKLGGVSYLKEYAANKAIQYKAELATDGTQKYYSSTVDEVLAEVNAKIEKLTVINVSEVDTAFSNALTGQTKAEIDAALTVKKTAAKAEISTGTYASAKWDGERKTKVEAIQEEASAAIDAATSTEAIDSIVKDAKAKMDAILNTATITAQKGYVDTEYANTYKTLIDGYIDTLIQKNGTQNYDAATQKTGMEKKVKEYYYNLILAQENPKLSAAEVKTIMAANYSGALAVVESNLLPKAALEAAEKTLIAQIDALNPVVFAENTAQVFSAFEAYQAYMQMNGSSDTKITNKWKLNLAVTKAVSIEKSAIETKQTALVAKPALTLEDKAAVDALKAEIDAFNTKYKGYPGFTEITYNTGLDTKIETALYQDAVEKINAIPEELTYADKETVESARAAYDALSDGQKDALNPSFKNKLESAEKQIEPVSYTHLDVYKRQGGSWPDS